MLRRGPRGHYVWRRDGAGGGAGGGTAGAKSERVSVPKGMALEEIDLDAALALLSLPREMGTHPDPGEPFLVRIERFGLRLRHGPTCAPTPRRRRADRQA